MDKEGKSGAIGAAVPDFTEEIAPTEATDEAKESEGEQAAVEIALSDEQCKALLDDIVHLGILDWKHITSKILQSLQPPQTATHIPQLAGIRERYPNKRRWAPARRWMYAQYGPCPACGTGMNLTHDHVLPVDLLGDRADMLENLRFLCYRDNQSRHWKHGGKLELGTAAACIYLLLTRKPRSLAELTRLGRQLGLTQSSQRFEETWALAVHLHLRGLYDLDEIHPAIEEEELKKFQAYYAATNSFFEGLAPALEERFGEAKARASLIQFLITTRSVQPTDRLRAVTALGIEGDGAVMKAAEKKKISDADRRLFLNALGYFSNEEVEYIVARKKVALFHLLNGDEREELLAELEAALAKLQTQHGVADSDATPRTS